MHTQRASGWMVIAAALVAGCTQRLPAPPSIAAVTPASGRIGASVVLRIEGQFPVRAFADLGGRGRNELDVGYQARLGDAALEGVQLSEGVLTAGVPIDLPAGVYDLTVVDPWGREGSFPGAYQVLLPASGLAFTSAPQFVSVGACSSALAFELQDATGGRATTDAELTVSFAATSTALGFFADPACTQRLTDVLVPAGAGSGQVYFSGQTPAVVTLKATAPGLSAASQIATITAVGSTLVFASPPQTMPAGACSAIVSIALEDSSGNPAAAPAPIVLAVAVSGAGFELFADAQCTIPPGTVTLAQGATSTGLYFRGTIAGARVISASANGLGSASQTETIVAGPASQLVFTQQPANAIAGSPFSTQVSVEDAFGNVVTSSTAAVVIGIGTNPGGGTLSGTTTLNAVAGVADFSSLSIDRWGTGYTLTAESAPLPGATSAPFDITPAPANVQSGTASVAINGTVPVTINAIDPSRAFLIFQVRADSNRPVGSYLAGRIADATTIEFIRVTDEVAPIPAIEVEWYVVEHPGVRVQRGTVIQTATVVDVPIAPVASVSQAFVTWSKTPDSFDVNMNEDDLSLGTLTSTTNLEFRTGVANSAHVVYWQVIEYVDSRDVTVQTASTSFADTELSKDVTIAPVNVAKTFVLAGYRVSLIGLIASMGSRMVRAQLVGPSTVRVDRGLAGEAIDEIHLQVIELKTPTARVQSGSEPFPVGTAQRQVPISAVDVTRAAAFGSSQPTGGQDIGLSTYAVDDVLGVGSATLRLSSPSQLTLARNNTAGDADLGWFVVEF